MISVLAKRQDFVAEFFDTNTRGRARKCHGV
jgi:hypothetical protein